MLLVMVKDGEPASEEVTSHLRGLQAGFKLLKLGLSANFWLSVYPFNLAVKGLLVRNKRLRVSSGEITIVVGFALLARFTFKFLGSKDLLYLTTVNSYINLRFSI